MRSQTAWALPVCVLILATSGFADEPAEGQAAAIAALRKLGADVSSESVSIRSSEVTDADLIHLKEMTNVTKVALMNCQKVTDAGLEHGKGLPNLQQLHLNETEISDAGLEHLKGLTNLSRLELTKTKVTDAGAKKLQQALPHCSINHSPRT